MRACAYIRVSSEEQGDSGLSLEAQDDRVRQEITHRGWTLTTIFEEIVSTKKPVDKRRKLNRALRELQAGEHDVLVCHRVDRLCRSSLEFHQILQMSDEQGWKLLMLQPQVDTTTPYGAAMAGMAAIFAQLERDLISQRTKEALAVLRRQGKSTGGPVPFADQQTIRTIQRLKTNGHSDREVADLLNLEGIPAARGGHWYQSTVNRVNKRAQAAKA